MKQQVSHNYTNAIRQIKSAILKSRYRAAALTNRELLSLYYGIGKYISENSRNHFWRTNAVETISRQLQQELPGLRGFSIRNLKNMRQFFEAWEQVFTNRQPITAEIDTPDISPNRSPVANEIQTDLLTANRQPSAGDLLTADVECFLSIGFTHHCEILAKTDSLEERLFYIQRCASEFWSKETLRHHLKSKLYAKQGKRQRKYKMRKRIVKYLTIFIFWLKSKEPHSESSVISLAPRVLKKEEDIRTIRPYLDELERSLAESKLTNIAVAGTYGSGKSTVIKTFQDLHPEYEYINISLASFRDNEENKKKKMKREPEQKEGGNSTNGKTIETDSEINTNSQIERRLEISILQQIFYHVKPSEIPDSRFKRIRNNKWWKLLLISLNLIIWLISTLILFKFSYIKKIDPSTWDSSFVLDWISIITFCFFFTGIGYFTKYIVRLFSNSKINKFSIKGELELGDNLDKSVFNEHLEEIIYFFERTPYNVVIIEDLDRFDTTDIFTKLRELNILLNSSKLIKREINFIYAVKDELFTDKNERVKFFDFIIPIIPFINASNASVKLNELKKTRRLENVLTDDFTRDIVSFIDDIDMRLLINIFHEFCIYRNIIPVEVQDNLFAMIVYKNMYPDDFGKLSKKEGNLYNFISGKKIYTTDIITKVDKQIMNKEAEIGLIKSEKITSEKELRSIYINAIQEKMPNAVSIISDSLSFAALNTEENFDKVKTESNILYYFYQFRNNSYYYLNSNKSNISFSDIENFVNPDLSYEKRKQLIQEKHNNKIDQIKKEIESLKNKKRQIEVWSLKEIFQESDIEPYLNIFSNNQMMRSLLINGYINEDYEDYITLFHEGNITQADEAFNRKVKSGIRSDFSYQLSNKVGNLVKVIPEKYFKREIILNFDLLDYLSENANQHQSKYDDIIFILSNEKESSIDFIDRYIERDKNLPLFIKSLCHSWNNWWDFMFRNDDYLDYHDDKLRKYLKLIVENADISDILLMNKSNGLSNIISMLPDFLSLIDKSCESKIKDFIKELQIKFKQLQSPNKDTELLFDFIYKNNYYEINENNIHLMLTVYNKTINEQILNESNYTTILNSNCKSLIDYIEKNISSYIKDVFLKIEKNKKEKEETIIKLLNNDVLSATIKTDIIKKQETLIMVLSTINSSETKRTIIESNKLDVSWNNLYFYYESLEEVYKLLEKENSLDETLIVFLNKEENYTLLSKQVIKDELEGLSEDNIKKFSLCIIYCNELNLDSYKHLVKSTHYKWNNLNFEHLDNDKVKWLVETNFLSLTEDNFNKLKQNFPNEHIRLIERQQNSLSLKIDELPIDKDDILSLLKSKVIRSENKVKMINKIDSDFITNHKDIAKATCDILANSTFIPLDIDVIESLVNSSSLKENKIKILNMYDKELNDSQLQNFIESFEGNYVKLFKKRSRPKFSNTDYHELLFKNLKNRGLIKRHEPYKDNQLKVIANY